MRGAVLGGKGGGEFVSVSMLLFSESILYNHNASQYIAYVPPSGFDWLLLFFEKNLINNTRTKMMIISSSIKNGTPAAAMINVSVQWYNKNYVNNIVVNMRSYCSYLHLC